MHKSILLLLLTLFVCSAQAREIAGVDIPETVTISGVVAPLNLNGVAIRSKFFFKIYIAALYVTETSHDANLLLVSSSAKRMMMHMLYSEVEKEKLTKAWQEGFEKNLPAALFNAIKPKLDRFNDMFSTMRKDDVALIDFIPGVGTRVTIRGEDKGVIEGADFYRAVLSVWIGDEPATEDLKEGVLGVAK